MENELFEKAPVHKAYLKLAMPVVLGMVVSLVYNMVDTWFIARTGDTSLVAGVSLCAPVFSLMLAFGDIFGLGASSVISRLFGAKQYEESSHVHAFSFYTALGWSLVCALVMLVFKNPILRLLGAKEDTFASASAYYTWLAVGAPAIILSLVPNNTLRTEGLAFPAMIGTIIGSVLNIILDPIFIFTLGLGAAGAAIATVLSNAVTVILYIVVLLKKSKNLSIKLSDYKASASDIGQLFAIGLPASITNLMQSFAIMMTNRYLLPYGTDKIAALGIAMKVNMIVMLTMVGFAFGGQPLYGYSYGAGNTDRLKKTLRFALTVELTFSVVMTALFILLAPGIIRIFIKDPAVVSSGTQILRALVVSMPLMGVILVLTTLFQSAGKALPAFILSLSRQGLVLLIMLILLSALFGYYGVIYAQAASDLITCLIAVILTKTSHVFAKPALKST